MMFMKKILHTAETRHDQIYFSAVPQFFVKTLRWTIEIPVGEIWIVFNAYHRHLFLGKD